MSQIEMIIKPHEKDLGDDFIVRRCLPDAKKRMVGPFIFWDHMGPTTLSPEKPLKVRAHPHIGLATITWLLTGRIMHRDNLGNQQEIKAGEVNWMTSGKGIVHSERSRPEQGTEELEGVQLWLALPKEHEDVDPNFFHCKVDDVPQFTEGGCHLRLIAGKAFGKESPVPVYSQLFYIDGNGKAGSSFQLPVTEGHEGAVYVLRGRIQSDSQEASQYQMMIFREGSEIQFTIEEDSKFLVLGGEIFPEKRLLWWNFVSTSQDKIEAAKKMWRNNEYPPVINEDEWIPLPED